MIHINRKKNNNNMMINISWDDHMEEDLINILKEYEEYAKRENPHPIIK